MVDKKSTSVILHSLQLKDYKCFKGDNLFLFGSKTEKKKLQMVQCTIFLGNNGTGKTNILKTIANISPEIDSVANKDSMDTKFNTNEYKPINITASIGVMYPGKKCEGLHKDKPVYHPRVIERYLKDDYKVSATFAHYCGEVSKSMFKEEFHQLERESNIVPNGDGSSLKITEYSSIGYQPRVNYTDPTEELEDFKIYAYGVNRFSDTKRNLVSENLVNSLFYNNYPLINLEEWLLQLEIAQSNTEEVSKKSDIKKRIKLIKGLLKRSNLFPDIDDYYIHVDDNYNSEVLFKTKEGDFRLNELGYGYQCMFAWVFDFMKKLFDRYPKSKNPLAEPAVLLIDEIDLHLHPQWQRHVIKDLCELFPNTQLIVTTHSPLVIQSIDSINLFILSKEGDHTKVTHCTEDTFQGWSVEEILRELMDLGDNIRSPKYEKLRDDFESAMNRADLKKGERAYNELKKILHPQNVENKLLDMDLGQLKAMQDD